MNITFKDTSNISSKAKMKPTPRIPFSIPSEQLSISNSPFNILEERPLKTNSQNLSFKGLSFSTKVIRKGLSEFEKTFGKAAKENFETKIEQAISYSDSGLTSGIKKGLTYVENEMKHTVIETLAYPFKNLPIDAANGAIDVLKRTPFIKNLSFLDSLENIKALKTRRTHNESISNASSISGYLDMIKKNEEGYFTKAHDRFNPLKGNYGTTAERSLTRFVSGLIPAFFLANDAFNLSMYMNNNKDIAKKEKKKRFNQEVSRILITTAATFGALKIFGKGSNQKQWKGVAIINLVTITSEIIGRKLVGSPVIPINSEQAREYAIKQGKIKVDKKQENVNFNSSNLLFNAKAQEKSKENKKDKTVPKKGALNFKNVLKGIGSLVVFGYGVKKFQKMEFISNFTEKFKTVYDRLLQKDYTILKEDFDKLIAKLKAENKFNGIAEHYEDIVQNSVIVKSEDIDSFNLEVKALFKSFRPVKVKDKVLTPEEIKEFKSKEKALNELLKTPIENIKKGVITREELKTLIENLEKKEYSKLAELSKKIALFKQDEKVYNLGKVMSRPKEIAIHHVLSFPIRYVWGLMNVPYKLLVTLDKTIDAGINALNKTIVEKSPEKVSTDIEVLRNSIDYITKIGKDSKNFEKKLNASLLAGFDSKTKTSFSNADLGSMVKNTCSATTSAFLIADNYNMVMIDSQGKDKDLAGQKAKERTVQRLVRLAYGAFLIKFFNNMFAHTFNGSLLGAQSVNTLYTMTTETMERTSVGLPLGESNKEEMIAKEKAHLNADGFAGSYYRFMAKLTGKKPLEDSNKK